jgi:dihydropyrimidinase
MYENNPNCPGTFNPDQKQLGHGDFTRIPNGVNGIEDRLSIVWSNGVAKGVLTPSQFVAVTSANAAKLFGCYPRKGVIEAGADADLVVWDGARKRTISAKTHHHAVTVNIFEGQEVTGCADVTVSGGRIVWQDGKLNVEQGKSRYVPRTAFAAAFEGLELSDKNRCELKLKVERD